MKPIPFTERDHEYLNQREDQDIEQLIEQLIKEDGSGQ